MATGDGGPRIRELTAGEEIDDIEDDDDDFEDETILERILVRMPGAALQYTSSHRDKIISFKFPLIKKKENQKQPFYY